MRLQDCPSKTGPPKHSRRIWITNQESKSLNQEEEDPESKEEDPESEEETPAVIHLQAKSQNPTKTLAIGRRNRESRIRQRTSQRRRRRFTLAVKKARVQPSPTQSTFKVISLVWIDLQCILKKRTNPAPVNNQSCVYFPKSYLISCISFVSSFDIYFIVLGTKSWLEFWVVVLFFKEILGVIVCCF